MKESEIRAAIIAEIAKLIKEAGQVGNCGHIHSEETDYEHK